MFQLTKKYLSVQLLSFLIFGAFSLWWLYIQLAAVPGSSQYDYFSDTYGTLAGLGGSVGLFAAKKWGGLRSIMGKSVLLFSLGLLFQLFGQLVYSFYFFYLDIEAPYPSWGDLGYFGSIPLYIFGVIYLAKASGCSLSISKLSGRVRAIVLPTILLVVSYALFLQGYIFDWSNPLLIFLDFGYPLGQAVYVSLALLTYSLSVGVLGGRMKKRVFLVLGALLLQYLADFTFLYQLSHDTWYAGGLNDFMYLVAYFAMTVALVHLGAIADKLDTA